LFVYGGSSGCGGSSTVVEHPSSGSVVAVVVVVVVVEVVVDVDVDVVVGMTGVGSLRARIRKEAIWALVTGSSGQ
jgi:hypothetical protein